MRLLFLLLITLIIGSCDLPSGPDKDHPLYVPDPNRLYFLNTRQLDYTKVMEDEDSGIRVYLAEGIDGKDSPLGAYIIDYWIDGRAGLILRFSSDKNPKTIEELLEPGTTLNFNWAEASQSLIFNTDLISNAKLAEELFQITIAEKELHIINQSGKSMSISRVQDSYLKLRVVLNDYLKLIN
ncbi:MAG: hypothetical protein AAF741_13560 [Bacteroidota bacterium]